MVHRQKTIIYNYQYNALITVIDIDKLAKLIGLRMQYWVYLDIM